MSEILFREESFKIIGVCMEIHKSMGMGLKEINYKDAMEIEFKENDIHYEREKRFTVIYKGQQLRNPYSADFIVYDSVVLEVKSCTCIAEPHLAQALSYLAVSKLKLAIIINFGEKSLSWKRVIL